MSSSLLLPGTEAPFGTFSPPPASGILPRGPRGLAIASFEPPQGRRPAGEAAAGPASSSQSLASERRPA